MLAINLPVSLTMMLHIDYIYHCTYSYSVFVITHREICQMSISHSTLLLLFKVQCFVHASTYVCARLEWKDELANGDSYVAPLSC